MKQETSFHNGLLWTLVIVLTIMMAILVVGLKIGNGRWECSEYQEKALVTCPASCDDTEVIQNLLVDGMPCSITRTKVCTKEVWTREVKE